MTATRHDRFELLTLLSEACEVEHGLACCYLYAAVSLKQDLAEGGLTGEQLQKTRLWASQIFHVAAEEMLHLSQAWNLLSSIGGSPWYARPNFPQPSSYYPLHLPLETKPFSLDTLERFIAFEHPHDPTKPRLKPRPGDDAPAFRSVGELYALVRETIEAFPERELFIGDPQAQVTPQIVDFPDLIAISDRASAVKAIEMITEQGEGTPVDREDSHYDIFRSVKRSYLNQMLHATESGATFNPVRPCISNPIAHPTTSVAAPGANPITNHLSADVADTFDAIYGFMLRLLQYVFDGATDTADPLVPALAKTALALMTTVLKPLAESLTLLPAGTADYGAATAGPPFSIRRNVALPLPSPIAERIASESLERLHARLTRLASDIPHAPDQLKHAATNLGLLAIPSSTPVGRT